jgi:hypothetical protein
MCPSNGGCEEDDFGNLMFLPSSRSKAERNILVYLIELCVQAMEEDGADFGYLDKYLMGCLDKTNDRRPHTPLFKLPIAGCYAVAIFQVNCHNSCYSSKTSDY